MTFLLLLSLAMATDFSEATDTELIEALEEVDYDLRVDALEEIAKRGLLGYEAQIIEVVKNDPEPRVRRAAMAALEEMEAKGTLEACDFIVREDVEEGNRGKCLAWLERKGPDEGSASVIHVAGNDPSPKMRRKAAIIIGKRGWLAGREVLMEATGDADPKVALAAWHAIVRLGDLEQRKRVHTQLAESKDVELRRALVKAIGENPLSQDFEPLVAALDDPDREVAIQAARGLSALGDEAAGPILREKSSQTEDSKLSKEFAAAATKLGN